MGEGAHMPVVPERVSSDQQKHRFIVNRSRPCPCYGAGPPTKAGHSGQPGNRCSW